MASTADQAQQVRAEEEEKKDAQAIEDQARGPDASEASASANDADRERAARLGRELFVFTNAKAGMQSVDAARVQQVVYDMSKDSAFFQNSLRQNDRVETRIRGMQAQLAQLSRARREELAKDVDRRVAQLESARVLDRTVVVVDMDMFYAAVEMRDNPALRDVPLAVGGLSMISTTNYAARKFGVRAAMPGFIGKELCPSLVFVPPNFDKYTRVAQQIRAVFAQYDPDFSAFSLDEACLDISEYMAANWQRYIVGGGVADGIREGKQGGGGGGGGGGEEEEDDDDGGDGHDSEEMMAIEEWEKDGDTDPDDGLQGLRDFVRVSSASEDDECEQQPAPSTTSGSKTSMFDTDQPDDTGTNSTSDADTFAALHAATMSRKRRRTSASGPRVPPSVRLEVACAIVAEMRRKILDETQLTASAGIACNTMLAKICSDMNKPNGQFALPFSRCDVVAFVHALPVRKIGGIGKVMEKTLAALGVTTGGELLAQRVALFHVFSDKTASWLLRASLGIQPPRQPGEASARKSFSRERTFRALSDQEPLERKCREICDRLATDLAAAQVGARHVTLKLKLADFSVRSRSASLASAVSTSDQLFAVAVDVLRKELPLTLRLMGVRASRLVPLAGESSDGGEKQKKKKQQQLGIAAFATSDSEAAFGAEIEASAAVGAAKAAAAASNRMDAFVAALPSPMDAFQPCPICGRSLSVSNTIAVNAHMDACIDGRRESRPPSSQPATRKTKARKTSKAGAPRHKHSLHSFFATERDDTH